MHIIRLRGAWEIATASGVTTHARKFGRPRTLDANERLWLACDRVPGPCEVRVNGAVAGAVAVSGAFAVDITAILQPRNEVVFCVEESDAPLGDVSLQVRSVP